jgi:hypothetical protein
MAGYPDPGELQCRFPASDPSRILRQVLKNI